MAALLWLSAACLALLALLAQGAGDALSAVPLGVLIAAGGAAFGFVRWLEEQKRRDRERAEDAARRRALEVEARKRRLRELLVDVRAQMIIDIERLAMQFDTNVQDWHRDRMLQRLRGVRAEGREMPAAPTYVGADGGALLREEVGLMDSALVDRLRRYETLDRHLNALIAAFETGMYQDAADDRQTHAVEYFLLLGSDALLAALDAKASLDGCLEAAFDEAPRWAAPDDALRQRLLDQRNDRACHDEPPVPLPQYIIERWMDR